MRFDWFGGRKQFNGYLFSALVSFMAVPLDARFPAYATWMAVALLGTSGIIAWEDIQKRKTRSS